MGCAMRRLVTTEAEIRELVLTRGPLGRARNEEIYRGAFRDLPPKRIRLPLRRYNLGSKTVLEAGCAYGGNLFFWGEGSLGVDIGEEQTRFAQALGLNVVRADLNNADDLARIPDRAFDAIWSSHVLEHLAAPHVTLSILRHKLRDEGLLFVMVPIVPQSRLIEWLWKAYLRGRNTYDASEHIHAFTARTASYLIEKAGFQVLERNIFFPTLGPLNDLVNALLGSSWRQITIVAKNEPGKPVVKRKSLGPPR